MMELRNKPGEYLDRVAERGESFVIERNGQRKACLVPISVFLPDISPERVAFEFDSLEKAEEHPRPAIVEDNRLAFRFVESVPDGGRVTITIVLPHGYPSACPVVFTDLARECTPHRWADGSLCLFGVMAVWNPGKHSVKSVLDLSRRWLSNYYEWRKSDRWPTERGGADER